MLSIFFSLTKSKICNSHLLIFNWSSERITIETPSLPDKPFSPKPYKNFITSLIVASLFFYGLIFYKEMNSSIIKTPETIDHLNIPQIAILPKVENIKKGYHILQMFLEDSESNFSEAIRSSRAIIEAKFQKNKSILITSTYSGEGKTTISLNTALAFSKIGKVILIETDIRRPSVLTKTSQADEAPKHGFSDLIQGGDIKLSDCIMKLPGSEIEVMTSGTRRSDLTDLTTTKKLKTFFDVLKQNYDYVIIDTPPIQPVSDTLFISQATDHNLIIVRANVTKLVGIKSILKKLDNVGVKIDGIVLNDLDTSKASYYGYYQYGGYYNKYKSYS